MEKHFSHGSIEIEISQGVAMRIYIGNETFATQWFGHGTLNMEEEIGQRKYPYLRRVLCAYVPNDKSPHYGWHWLSATAWLKCKNIPTELHPENTLPSDAKLVLGA
jgi:hypothetical protein